VIAAAPTDGPRWLIADWLELEVLCTSSGSASVHAINADPILDPDTQPTAIDEDGQREEERLSRLFTEIEQRQEALGDSYPFAFSDTGAMLEQKRTGVGANVYLFCLLASHGRADGLLHNADILLMNEVPDLMQACATWSAAGFEAGPAYALGLDPSSNAFLPRLGEIFRAFGDGTPITAIPKGAPDHVKDDGIDVIAWRHMPDKVPPATFMMAQVASGQNWRSKAVGTVMHRFLNTWFSPAPARTPKGALMMPYCIDSECEEDEDAEQEALAMQWRRLVSQFGELFYRYKLPRYAAQGVELHKAGVHVDMVGWMNRLEAFIEQTVANLRSGSR
jgi:hypothetical protein